MSPGSARLAKGTTGAFFVTGSFSNLTVRDVSGEVTWASSDPAILEVKGGVAKGLATGSANVLATLADKSVAIAVRVTDAELTALAVTPSVQSMPRGLSARLYATGSYTDGTTQDVTAIAAWSSSDSSAVVVDRGTVTGAGVGSATVVASVGSRSAAAVVQSTQALVAAISIRPAGMALPLGYTQQFTATCNFTDGQRDCTEMVAWSTRAGDDVASISAGGLATSKKVGSTEVTATMAYGMCTADFKCSTTVKLDVTPAVLTKIIVSPNPYTLPAGLEYPFTATGEFSDKSAPRDISGSVVWTSSNTAVATSTPIAAHPGLFSALKPGDVTVTAAAPGLGGTVTGTALFHVVDAALLKVTVEPSGAIIPLGLTKAYKAVGHYTALPAPLQVDITNKVTWSISSDPLGRFASLVGQVSNAPVDKGLLTTVTEGEAYVHATEPITLVSGSAVVTVSSAKVMDLAIRPETASIPKGTTAQFQAMCTDTANRIFNCTEKVMWVSEDKGAHTDNVAPLAGPGKFYGRSTGVATIQAFLPQSCEWCTVSGASARAELTVTPATLVKLRVELQLPSCGDRTLTGPEGLSMDGTYMQPRFLPLRFAAWGQYTDYADTRTEIDLTASVNWGPNPDPRGVITWLDPHGVAMGLQEGHVDVRATLDSVVSPAFPLRILDFVLDSVAVHPDHARVAKGLDVKFQASGRFCPVDGHGSRTPDSSFGGCIDRCMTPWMNWSERDWPGYSGVATVASTGLAHGVAVGWSTISAQDPQTGKSGSADLEVSPAIVLAVSVTPTQVQVPLGNTQQFRAIAHYSDGDAPDVTEHADWSDGVYVTFRHGHHEVEGLGYTQRVSPGYVEVKANYHGIVGTALIQVLERQLLYITVAPNPKSIPVGSEVQFLATGHYTGDVQYPLGPEAVWDSSDEAVAAVSNSPLSWGLATGFAKGATTITAIAWDAFSHAYISGSASLTVGDPWIYKVWIDPACPSVIVDQTRQLTAWGFRTDNPGVKVDVTGLVGWTSYDPLIASVDANGLVKGVGAAPSGSSTMITATEPNHGAFGSTLVFVGCYCGKPVIDPGGSCIACDAVVSP